LKGPKPQNKKYEHTWQKGLAIKEIPWYYNDDLEILNMETFP
jgi:hypothetical protein